MAILYLPFFSIELKLTEVPFHCNGLTQIFDQSQSTLPGNVLCPLSLYPHWYNLKVYEIEIKTSNFFLDFRL